MDNMSEDLWSHYGLSELGSFIFFVIFCIVCFVYFWYVRKLWKLDSYNREKLNLFLREWEENNKK